MPKNGKAVRLTGEPRIKSEIYLGPTIPGIAVAGTVYRNGPTRQLKKAVEEVPAIGKLLVSVGDAAQIRKDLRNPASAAGICYKKAEEYAKRRIGK